jgi:hypothetical protein
MMMTSFLSIIGGVIDNERSGARVGSKNSKDNDRVDDEKTAPGWSVDASAIGWPPRLIR